MGGVAFDHTLHVVDAIHVEACFDDVPNIYVENREFRDKTGVENRFVRVLLTSPGFAIYFANNVGGQRNPLDPEVNGLFVEANDFAMFF